LIAAEITLICDESSPCAGHPRGAERRRLAL